MTSTQPVPTGSRVLLAHTNETELERISNALADAGHDVIPAKDGVDAVRRMAALLIGGEGLPDVIITRASMEGINGLHVLEGVEGCGWPVPVALVLDGGGFMTREEAYEMGASAAFPEQTSAEDIQVIVKDLVRSSARRGSRVDH